MSRSEKNVFTIERQREKDALSAEEKIIVAKSLSVQLTSITGRRDLAVDLTQALGAKDSAHDVFFVKTPDKDTTGQRETFACKRFRRLESAEHELMAMSESRKRGFKTLEPVGEGIYTVSDLGHVLVTRNMPRFTTMNYLGWRDAHVGQEDYQRKIAQPLQRIGGFIGTMHSSGIVHRDLQLKNLATDRIGTFVLFDQEDAFFQDLSNLSDFRYTGMMGDDLSVAMRSLACRGYLWDSTDTLFEREITTNCLDPYLDHAPIGNPHLMDVIESAMKDVMLVRADLHNNFSSRMGMPS